MVLVASTDDVILNNKAKEGARSLQTEQVVTFAELKTQLKTVTRQSRQ